ncbi:MAG: radical SAM protein, partial [Chloroflexi bacterium]
MRRTMQAGNSERNQKVSPVEMWKRQRTRTTHRIHTLPVVVLELTDRCNCRCVMCDIWQGGGRGQELTAEGMQPHLATFTKLDVRHVVLSGGEPLLHHDPWALCALLRAHGVAKITLLSTG